MPEGITREAVLGKMAFIAEIAKKEGFNVSPRLHVEIYGNKRGT
jgi:7-carboxy-7-deazaguanine synthase